MLPKAAHNGGMGLHFIYPTPPETLAENPLLSSMSAFRVAPKQHEALIGIAGSEDGSVGTVRHHGKTVCYATIHPPDKHQRFGESTVAGILELGAVESAPEYRSQRLARRLLSIMFAPEAFQTNIVIATMYYWHYDLEHTGLSTYSYRKLLEKLYGAVGFVPTKTDDPEIVSYPGNALMSRVGSNVPPLLLTEFEHLCFLRANRSTVDRI